jgi:uncharacterized repeat protein (TIGR02543 family)
MKKRKVLSFLLLVIIVLQMPIFYVTNAKTIDKTTTKSNNNTIARAESGLISGDLQSIKITKVTEEQIKDVPIFDETTNSIIRAFAGNQTHYSSTYGYNMLEKDEYRQVYSTIVAACEEFHQSNRDATNVNGRYTVYNVPIDNNLVKTDKLHTILSSIYYDHPEYYWLKNFSYNYNSSTGYVTNIIIECVADYYKGSVRSALQNRMNEEITRYLNLVSGVTSDYQKELLIHDEIINQVQYANDATGAPVADIWAHSIVGVFDTSIKKVVCEGYAKAFQLLMNACGIECNYVPGTATSNSGRTEAHGWNQVKLGGEWYNVDVTWDDPISLDGSSVLRHTYFNVTDAEFTNHTPGNSTSVVINQWCYPLPTCTARTFAYGYTLHYTQPSGTTVKLYKNNIELSDGNRVASGSAISVKAVPARQTWTYDAKCKINNQTPINMLKNVDSGNGEVSYVCNFTMPADNTDVVVTLTPTLKTYTVTFDSQGGSEVSAITDVVEGTTVTLPTAPRRSGYAFAGWYTNNTYTTVFDENTIVNDDITVYAKWEPTQLERINASYTGNNLILGSTINKSDITVVAVYNDGTNKVLLPVQFEISPETIASLGYNTVTVSYNGKTANVNIYGIEDSRVYTVTFDSQGGSNVNPITNVRKGDKITLPANPTKNEYFFGGWYTQRSCLTKFSADTEITSDITLYAKWVPLLSDPRNTIKNISATYTGKSILVGNSISKSDVIVKATDLNGAVHNVTSFTLSNYKITSVGDNTITATYGGFSTTFTVKGISTQSGSNKYIRYISAGYYGGPVEVGSSVDRNTITVIAAYNDNSVEYITDFYLSNNYITSIGKNTIYVYYYGYTASVTVEGVAKGSLSQTTPVQPSTNTSVLSSNSSINITKMTGGYLGFVFPRVTVTTNTHSSIITAEIEEKVLASAIEGKELGNTNILQLTLNNIGSQILTQLNRSNVDEVYVKVCIPVQYYGRNEIQISNISLDNATLNRIKNSGKSVVIQYIGSSYSTTAGKTYYTNPLCYLTLKGKEFNSTANSNVALRVTTLEKDYQIESVVNQYLKLEDRGKGVVVTLGQNGELNKFGSVTVDVGGMLGREHGDKVYVYGYNSKTKKLDELPITKYEVDKNQNITFSVSTYTKYIILTDETKTKVTTIASRSKVSKLLKIKKGNSKQITVKLPSDITKNDVKITYKSENSKVAYVSKTGKVYGKKKGKTKITTTVTYGNYSKSFTTKIIIK